jgi:hypothetical protein
MPAATSAGATTTNRVASASWCFFLGAVSPLRLGLAEPLACHRFKSIFRRHRSRLLTITLGLMDYKILHHTKKPRLPREKRGFLDFLGLF